MVDIAVLSGVDRLKRAGIILGISLAVALIAIPIPLVHFILVPGALIAGFILAGYRLTQSEIFQRVVGKCPFCGTEQTFPIMGKFRLPKGAYCSKCGRELSLDAS
ncbi:MAG: hypothetical protein ACRENN_07055 [Candidatus Eiseniibacteriota bacterium]